MAKSKAKPLLSLRFASLSSWPTYLAILTCVTTILMQPSESGGQDEIVRSLSHEEAIYVWTNDVRKLAEELEQIFLPNFFEKGNATSSARRTEEQENAARLREQIRDLWSELKEGSVFDGEAVIVVWPSFEQEGSPTSRAGLILETSLQKEEVEKYLKDCARVVGGLSDSRTSSEHDRSLGIRTYVDSYVIISSDVEVGEELKHQLSGRSQGQVLLFSSREFSRIKDALRGDETRNATVSVYVPGSTLDSIGVPLVRESMLYARLSGDDWRSNFFNEIRGFGGVIQLNNEGLSESTPGIQIAMTGRALVTRPRRGPWQAFGKEEIAYDDLANVPVPVDRISRFMQFKVDPDGTAKGASEVFDRTHPDNTGGFEKGVDPRTLIDRWCTVSYLDSPEAAQPVPRELLLMGTPDPEAMASNYDVQNETLMSRMTSAELEAKWPSLHNDEIIVWGESPNWIKKVYLEYRTNRDKARFELREAQKRGDDEEVKRQERLERLFSGQADKFEEMTPTPRAALIGPWIVSPGHLAVLPDLGRRFGTECEQMLELYEDVSRANASIGERIRVHGLMAWWPETLEMRRHWTIPMNLLSNRVGANGESQTDIGEESPDEFTSSVKNTLKSLVVIVGDSEVGIDLKVVLFSRNPMTD